MRTATLPASNSRPALLATAAARRGAAMTGALLASVLAGCQQPKSYECRYTATPPTLDGSLDDPAWAAAPWTADFMDIQGPSLPAPRYRTRAKMTWDDHYLYIGAEMEEPDLWAIYRHHDEIVFHQHDFEVFIDPGGAGREYYELEVNVLGTIFDLYLHRTYIDGGPAVHEWDAPGLKTAIAVRGTVNDPSDRDQGWTLEWAIPWEDLQPPSTFRAIAAESRRHGAPPASGDTWRLNFSRVEWKLRTVKGAYEKVPDTPEDNWVWSPQWEINMHRPEHWGRVTFVR